MSSLKTEDKFRGGIMKCPVCNNEMRFEGVDDGDDGVGVFYCSYCKQYELVYKRK